MKWCAASRTKAEVRVGSTHKQLLCPTHVFLQKVEYETIQPSFFIFRIDVLYTQTQIHANIVIVIARSKDQWALARGGMGVYIGTMITKQFDGPLTLLLNRLKEWRSIQVYLFLVKDPCLLL